MTLAGGAARAAPPALVIFAALVICVAVLAALVAATGTPVDDQSAQSITPHRHFFQTPSGLVEVGPRVCDDPAAQKAFSKFHERVHASAPLAKGAARGDHDSRVLVCPLAP